MATYKFRVHVVKEYEVIVTASDEEAAHELAVDMYEWGTVVSNNLDYVEDLGECAEAADVRESDFRS